MYNDDEILELTCEAVNLYLNEEIDSTDVSNLIESNIIDCKLFNQLISKELEENTASGFSSFANMAKTNLRDYMISKLPSSEAKNKLIQSKAKDMIKSGDKIGGYKLSADAHFDSMNRAYKNARTNKDIDQYLYHNDRRSRKLGIVRKLLDKQNNI